MKKKIALILIGLIILAIGYSVIIPKTNTIFEPDSSIATKIREKDGMAMIYVPGGEFTMGATFWKSIVFANWKLFLFPDQRPQHKVYLDGYWIDETEVIASYVLHRESSSMVYRYFLFFG